MKNIIHCACSLDMSGIPLNTCNNYKLYNSSVPLVIDNSNSNWKNSDNDFSSYMMDVIKSTTLNDSEKSISIDTLSQNQSIDNKLHAFSAKCKHLSCFLLAKFQNINL